MSDEEQSGAALEAFLAGLGERLAAREGVDKDLAAILREHLLVAEPSEAAWARAKAAILKLAGERANAAKAGGAGD